MKIANWRTSMDVEATYVCGACGEEVVVPIDSSQGARQDYVKIAPCAAERISSASTLTKKATLPPGRNWNDRGSIIRLVKRGGHRISSEANFCQARPNLLS